ncbi:MAG: hypothetical protein IPP06_05995 [Saprospiraceae bacterium]|nr:hypothetical protein [Candidatus Vicinibacter affinis]MBP6173967.1 hypothetical protein [Saprospiraceae bacterium]MBK6574327.1 hypothetical protein [Candidatus Vicinibacter affinis]MBK6824847.1 hypothetical protein [Candidatus Vicinibacter affinis]MBK7304519.1 hypothetical protein [Candidatus Vicinibacter affinis]
MQALNKTGLWCAALALMLSFSGCQKDYFVYEINDQTILPVNSQKIKPKSITQYISILYTNFFQRAISPNSMLQAQKAIESIGDKQVAFDILLSKYMNDPKVILPTVESMRQDPEGFIRNTYKRFLVREPTEAELNWMLNYIKSRPNVTPEHFYFAFGTCNEHFHY